MILDTLLMTGLALTAPARVDEAALRTAIDRAFVRIEKGVINYPKHRQCFSCHHQAMAVFSMTAARERGYPIDKELLQKQITFSLRSFRNRESIAKGRGVGGDSTSVVYILNTLAAVKRPADETTGALVAYLLARQNRDGSWPVPAQRPPTMGSLFTNTGLAMRALKEYGGEGERVAAALRKGRAWLLENRPVSNEDKVFHLLGLVDAGADVKSVEAARTRLVNDQLPDGSWRQLATMSGDAYATATALAALRRAGLAVRHEAYRKGVKYLLETQRGDGAWVVQTRARPIQVFFDNGDAGGKSQFISYATTNWAAIALLETLPAVAGRAEALR